MKADEEKKIADDFLKLKTVIKVRDFIEKLPAGINVQNIQKFLSGDSKKFEFAFYYYGKENLSNKAVRNFIKRKNEIAKEILKSKNDYSLIGNIINPLREKNEDLLIKESLKISYKKTGNSDNIFKEILQAQTIAEIVKENNCTEDILNKILKKNISVIKYNKIIRNNLKDLFKFDKGLKVLNPVFEKYFDNLDAGKPVKDIINDTENKILNGDIDNIYDAIEKSEKNISNNISLVLIEIYNSIQVMDGKKKFVGFIEEYENESIAGNDIEYLNIKSNEYRNNILPKKWLEIKKKLKHTNILLHYKAWYHGLQQGRYKTIVANVKEYIVREILKKIFANFRNIDLKKIDLLSMIENSESIEKIKSSYSQFKDLIKLNDSDKKGVFSIFEDFIIFYFYLKYDLSEEVKIINDIVGKLKDVDNPESKLNLLKKFKIDLSKNNQDEVFKTHITNIIDKIIHLYNLICQNIKNDNDAIVDEVLTSDAFINRMVNEYESNGDIDDLKGKVQRLSEDIKMDVINKLSFDYRFEKYFPEVEDSLYDLNYGKAIGLITLKVKQIEKQLGMLASEQYLDDLINRMTEKTGKDSFLIKKIINMKNHLRNIHLQSTKKLHLMQEKISACKNNAEKILQLQKMSKDPGYKGIFGVVQNMEKILIRDHFNEIYDKIKKLPVDNQIALFASIKNDLEDLFAYEPNLAKKINDYISLINYNVKNYKEKLPVINTGILDSLQGNENGELSLINIEEIIGLEKPDKKEYEKNNVDAKLEKIDNEVNSLNILTDDLEFIIEGINDDISIFKIEDTDQTKILKENANYLLHGINQNIDKLKNLDEMINTEKPDDLINTVMNDNQSISEKINILETAFCNNDYDYNGKEKGFLAAIEIIKDKSDKTALSEIIEVVRRIKSEAEVLNTIEAKIAMLNDWIENDYKDKIYIVDFLRKQIKEFEDARGREGGLLRKLLDGLENSKDKIKYLNDKLIDPEYKHIVSAIKNLLNNIKEELDIKDEDINEELIDNFLEGKNDDEQLDYLKTRQNWDKYGKCREYIDTKVEDKKNKISKKEIIIYRDIFELISKISELDANRQSFIKYQIDNDADADEMLQSQRKLLFYLFAMETQSPEERIKSLVNRVTISINDKKKYLYLLKTSIKDALDITDDIIAYYSLAILQQDKSNDLRIKYLQRFKTSDDDNSKKYKEAFGITDYIINKYINDLSKKVVKKDETGNIETEDVNKTENLETASNYAIKTVLEENTANNDFNESEENSQDEGMLEEKNEEAFDDNIGRLIENNGGNKNQELVNDNKNEINFTEEELKNISKDKPAMVHKSIKEIIAEQSVIDDIKKRKKIAEIIVEKSKKANKEVIEKIKTRAHEIYKNETKKNEDKITDLLSYLATCYPEAVSHIIAEEILPIFRADKLNLDVHNLLESINNSVFKYAMNGKDPEENIKFLSKTLSPNNILNIKNIVNKIKDIWEKESKLYDKTNKQTPAFNKEESKGMGSVIIYLNSIDVKKISDELKNHFLTKIKNDLLKNDLNKLDYYLTKVFAESKTSDAEFEELTGNLKLEDKYKKVLKNIIIKIIKSNQSKEKIIDEKINPVRLDADNDKNKIDSKEKSIKQKLENISINEISNDNIGQQDNPDKLDELIEVNKNANENVVVLQEEKNNKENNEIIDEEKLNEDIQNILNDNAGETLNNNDGITAGTNKNIDPVENALMDVNRFIKPHSFILDFIRINKMDEADYDVDKRRDIIKKLYDDNKIFTYDGSTYIGKGNINFIVKSNLIPQSDRSVFTNKLDEFLKRFKNKNDIYSFLGVSDETEYRKLLYELDKYGLNKSGGKSINTVVQESAISEKENTKKPVENKINKQRIKSDDIRIPKEKNIPKKTNTINNSRELLSKSQKEVLDLAEKEINKKIERLIKSSETLEDLLAIHKNYFGSSELNKKNLLNLCYDIKQIATIINNDKELFLRLSFDRNKIQKLYDGRYDKLK